MKMKSRQEVLQEQNQMLRLLPEARWRLRHIPGITSIGVGAKEVGGEVTFEMAFRVYVDQKLPMDQLTAAWRIPERIRGIPTDVLRRSATEMLADAGKYRPLKGGSQVKNQFVEGDNDLLAGTIGCLVRFDSPVQEVLALSCEHVLLAGQSSLQVTVGQPRYVTSCCCCIYNQIGKVVNYEKNNLVDCAVAQLDQDIVTEVISNNTLNEVIGIGALTGVAQAVCFEPVRKRGRTTELTTGQVVDVIFENSQILVHPTGASPRFADRGDSGAVIVNAANRVIGLLWATDAATRTRGVGNHIGEVMREMDILIAGQSNAGLNIPTIGCGSSSGP
jgi:hypothetical protein